MFPGFGTVLNIATIIIGGTLGVFIGSKISEKLRNLITDVLGCVTIISAAAALLSLIYIRSFFCVLSSKRTRQGIATQQDAQP